jgi:uncharacterized caspase-like protein
MDADAVAASLRNVGFETVTLVLDVPREKLIDTLRTFADQTENADWAMVCPVMAAPGEHLRLTMDEMHLHPIAIELDLVDPAVPANRLVDHRR